MANEYIKNNELKRCPFCGSTAIISKLTMNGTTDYSVKCNMDKGFCKVIPETWRYDTEQEAIDAWNIRSDNNAE